MMPSANVVHTVSMFGTLPGWITAMFSAGSFSALGAIWLKSRKIKIAEREFDREGYGEIIDMLKIEVASLKESMVSRDLANAVRDERLSRFEELSGGLKIRVGQLESALRIAIDELAETSPNSPALRLIRTIMSSLYPVPGLDEPELHNVAEQLRNIP